MILEFILEHMLDIFILAFIVFMCIKYWDKIKPVIIKIKKKVQERKANG